MGIRFCHKVMDGHDGVGKTSKIFGCAADGQASAAHWHGHCPWTAAHGQNHGHGLTTAELGVRGASCPPGHKLVLDVRIYTT
ncbi:MAG: hypothetical protein WCR59_01755, partial [Planctomycetota bacterium]